MPFPRAWVFHFHPKSHNPKPTMHMQLLEPPKPNRPTPNLILHCGTHKATLDEVQEVRTPRSTSSWCPIQHNRLIDTVQKTLASTNLRIGTQAHSLSHEGQRYFGLMEINGKKTAEDYCWVLGLRNSHDKTVPAGIVTGASVFVCDTPTPSQARSNLPESTPGSLSETSPGSQREPSLNSWPNGTTKTSVSEHTRKLTSKIPLLMT